MWLLVNLSCRLEAMRRSPEDWSGAVHASEDSHSCSCDCEHLFFDCACSGGQFVGIGPSLSRSLEHLSRAGLHPLRAREAHGPGLGGETLVFDDVVHQRASQLASQRAVEHFLVDWRLQEVARPGVGLGTPPTRIVGPNHTGPNRTLQGSRKAQIWSDKCNDTYDARSIRAWEHHTISHSFCIVSACVACSQHRAAGDAVMSLGFKVDWLMHGCRAGFRKCGQLGRAVWCSGVFTGPGIPRTRIGGRNYTWQNHIGHTSV
jgi:hypothetical protein